MSRRSNIPAPLLLAALLSGAAALVFETLWARSLAIVLGSTVQAHSLIFAAFMLGLAVGAYAFGRVAERSRHVTRLYAIIELGIGLSGLAVGLVLHRYGTELAGLMGTAESSHRLGRSFAVSVALVGIPTALMGATFPLLLEAARHLRGRIVDLYGVYALNTLGAAGGTLTATLVAIPVLGVTGALYLAASFNLAAGVFVWTLPRHAVTAPPGEPDGDPARPPPPTDASQDGPRPPGGATGGDDAGRPAWPLLVSAFASGLVVLSMEVVWSRLASFFLGNRTLAFTVLVAWVLTLLAAGSWLAGKLAPRAKTGVDRFFGLLYAAGAAAIIACAFLAYLWVGAQAAVEAALPHTRKLLLLYRIAETGLLLGPMMLVLGCVFPMSLLCSPGVGERTGTLAGRFYLVNTVGAVLGSLVTGFWGVSRFGTFPWVGILVLVCCATAGMFLYRQLRQRPGRRPVVALLLVGLATALSPLVMSLRLGRSDPGQTVLLRREDEYGVLQVLSGPGGVISVVNNRTELVYLLGKTETAYVQQLQGHLGMVYCPGARRAVVLGSGYGITAGALGLHPSLEHIDAVEIIPGMVEAASLFMPHNLAYHHNPKIRVVVDDGRHFLTRATEPYDIISVNVSDAHLPGASSLFHREFYDIAKARLNPGGVVIQHAFGVDVAIVMATLEDSFPHVAVSRAYGNGYNVVASPWPLAIDEARVRQLLSAPAVRRALWSIGVLPPLDLVSMLKASRSLEVSRLPGAGIATDDHPLLELSWSGDTAMWLFINE